MFLVVFLAATSSDTVAGKKKKKKKVPESFEVNVSRPTLDLEPAEGYPSLKEIGGVRIELVPKAVEIKPMKMVSIERRSGLGALDAVNNAMPVWVTEKPFFKLDPKYIRFKVRVTSHLGRVLRLDGVAIQFSKDGKMIAADATEQDLNRAMILPEKSWEGELRGPKATQLSGSGVLFVGLYDVITEMDEASNPTKRSNFEWVYSYQAGRTSEKARAAKYKARVTAEQAQLLIGEHPADATRP